VSERTREKEERERQRESSDMVQAPGVLGQGQGPTLSC
jgi:hypothetical protein